LISTDLKIKILTNVLIPSFAISFERGEDQRLIRGQTQEEDKNVFSVFISKVVSPFMSMKESDDGLRIALLQFACLLVERASVHIHSTKKEDFRQLTTFGYSSLLHSKNYWDPTAIYNGHLLLSHIISTIANKKTWQEVVFKVFHSLLKAHAIEARHIVRQTLEVFMPIMPLKINESNLSLINLTKSVIIKDGYAILQLYHVFQVIIRHHTIYYPVRHQLIQNMINSMQRLESSNSVDYRKLAIDIAEVIINWELRRIKESNEENDEKVLDSGKRILPELLHVTKKLGVGENSPQPSSSMSLMQQDESVLKPIEWIHCKAVLNFLFELLFMLSEQVSQNPAAPNTLSLEVICKLSSNLLKKVLKKDVWLNRDENIQFPRLVKVFEEPSKVSSISICNFLEIFIHILDELEPNKILQMFAKLQTGLATCVTSTTTKVLRLMSNFLSKVIKMFPFGQYYVSDELQFLYRTVKTTIRNGLEIYEKDSTTMTSTFFGTFLILKTAFSSDPEYFKMFVDKFSKFVILLKNEHLTQNTQQTTVTTTNVELTKEMLLQSLHLLKFHISHMHPENRKYFINNILVELIEKSNDSRVLKTIIQVMEGWFKLKNAEQEPTLREKILLMQKLTHHIESRFAQDLQLNVQFLELIHFIYSDDDLNVTELTSKLDQAFISGLRCTQADVRKKFYAFFDEIVEKSIFDRLLYILTTKSWSSISQNFWIKQSVELLMLTAKSKEISSNSINLPSIGAGLNFTTSEEARNFYQHSEVNRILNFDDEGEVDTLNDSNLGISSNNREQSIKKIINSQIKFENFNRNVKVENFLSSAIQLCHIDSKLAEYIWITMFPKLWKTLTDDQRIELGREIIPFLSSGININHKETNFNAINTFVQALSLCDPPIFIPPSLMKSMSKSHNMYHRMALVAEDMHSEFEKIVDREADSDDDNEDAQTLNDIFINLSQMYEMLHEEDMWSGLWEKHAKYPDTNLAIFYERLGHFEEAQIIYESVLLKSKQDISNGADVSDFSNEIQLWDQHWIRCTKELNEWPILTSFAQNNKEKQAFLLLESAMKNYDWNMMKQALLKAEQNSSKHSNYKLSLYNGYVSMLALKENSAIVTKHIEVCSTLCLQQWRKLPRIVSQMHIPILQTAQQIMELQEASQIHQDLLKKNTLQLHDMKSIVKTWRNRLPTISDDLSHWNEIFTWRQYHYQLVIDSKSSTDVSNLGSQASAQTMIKMGKIARKHNMLNFAQKSLQGIESISSVPLTDVFHRIVQSVKCSIHLSSLSDESSTHLSDALKTLESIKFDHFNNNTENLSVLHAYRGNLLTYLNRSAEASKCFNTACELNENSNKSWALYGEYLEIIFTQNPKLIQHGISAMTCYLHASRDLSETKTRKYLSKVIWLLTYEEARPEMLKVLENHMLGVQTINWLPWVPQLLNCLVQYDTEVIITLLNQVAKIYPQAIYFSIRTIFLMLKLEQRERHKCVELAKAQQGENNLEQPGTSAQPTKSTQAMFRCSKIMQLVREVHPTIVFSLEGILEQMVAKTDPEGIRWFRENAFEENLHHLKQGLVKFYVLAFDNKLRINEATITQQTLNFLKKLVTNFSQVTENMSEVVLQDPVFIKLKMQFASGFDFQQPERNKLLDLIRRMKNCIRIMEAKVKTLPK
jgi:transformation/transcription domain-associated protein